MNNITIRQGSQLDLQVNQGDENATSVTLLMRNQETDVTYSVSANYSDGVATLTLDSGETSVVGTYDYQINENIPGEDPVIYPDNCIDGDCSFPTIEICESIIIS